MIEGRILLLGDDPKTAPGLRKTLGRRAFALYQVKEKSNVAEKILGIKPELIILNFISSCEDNFEISNRSNKIEVLGHSSSYN